MEEVTQGLLIFAMIALCIVLAGFLVHFLVALYEADWRTVRKWFGKGKNVDG